MSEYRVYILDCSGLLTGFKLFHADNDEEAIAGVQASNPGQICQIWNDRHLLAVIGEDGPAKVDGVANLSARGTP